jgi:hypothetical protein
MTKRKADKKPIEEYQADPERYKITAIGTVIDKQQGGQIITAFPELNPHAITPATSREFRNKQLARRRKAIARGNIKATAKFLAANQDLQIEMPDPDNLTDDELVIASSSADELAAYLFRLAWLQNAQKVAGGEGGNPRAVTEGYSKVFEAFDEDPRSLELPPGKNQVSMPVEALQRLMEMMEKDKAAAVDRARAVEAETI